MGRPYRFSGKQLVCVVALLKQHGPTETRKILAAPVMSRGKPNKLAALRNAKVFPEPEKVSLPTLCKIAAAHEVEFTRGRENPITSAKNAKSLTRHALSLVKSHGAVQAAAILASEDNGVSVCAATLRKLADEAGIKLVRGRRKAA